MARMTPPCERKDNGFTIVELLIVIVVIGILAAITIVAFNGVQDRARNAALQSDVKQGGGQIELLRDSNGNYPVSVASSSLKASAGTTLTYQKINDGYCLTGSNPTIGSYFSVNSGSPSVGPCPIGYWPLDGSADDKSPYANNGTVMGATLTADRKGNANRAYLLGDSAQYIKIGNPAILTTMPSAGFSYSIWIMRTGASVGHWPVIMGDSNSHVGYSIRSGSYGDSIYFESGKTPYDGVAWLGTSGLSLPINEWHMATITYDMSSLKFYWDGVLRTSDVRQINPTNGTINLGSSTSGFVGSVDDARIYDHALTPVEVKQLYQAS